MKMEEREITTQLKRYFESKNLEILGKFDAFDHPDDDDERSFQIDLAIGPLGTKGCRSLKQQEADKSLFEHHSSVVDPVIEELNSISLFPRNRQTIRSWTRQANPNPLVGIAIEIENNLSKYFLGSLLAAAITGRWGIVIIENPANEYRWISTLERMMHKGAVSPIPPNILIFSWPTLSAKMSSG
jgi:hypothetical protein